MSSHPGPHSRTRNLSGRALGLLPWLIVVVLVLVPFLRALDCAANDDTFVYFTYARNFAEGRFFAYDPRGIPTEGFTSLLWMLLLVPAELFDLDPFAGAVLLSVLALVASAFAATALFVVNGNVARRAAPLYVCVLLFLLTRDARVAEVTGRALETTLSPLFVFAACLCAARALRTGSRESGRWSACFFVAAFLAYLVRPEHILALAVGGAFVLAFTPHRALFLKQAAVFVAAFLGYHAAKLLVFGDVFPTGYYRKLGTSAFPGLSYVRECLVSYRWPLVAIAGAALALLARPGSFAELEPRGRWGSLWPVLLGATVTLAFFTRVNPMIGYGHRFLFTVTFTVYALLALAATNAGELLLRSVKGDDERKRTVLGWALAAALTVSTAIDVRSVGLTGYVSSLNVWTRASRAFEDHLYIRLGNFLRERIPAHREVTLLFGDAGGVPYAFDCILIDPNGLVEPPIARMFRLPNGPEKERAYADYVIDRRPDVALLAFGRAKPDGSIDRFAATHGPFGLDPAMGVHARLRDDGFVYLCTLPMYYDLHLGVNPRSPRFAEVVSALREYADAYGGTTSSTGLTLRDGDVSVTFPPLMRDDG